MRLFLPVLLLVALAPSAVHAVKIGEVKSTYPEGASVFLYGVLTYVTPTECYIQSQDRSAGIWAEADTAGLNVGDGVYLTGDIATESGERVVRRTYLSKTGYPQVLKPLAMLNRNLGGAALGLQPGVDDRRLVRIPSGDGWIDDWQWFAGSGPNNVGLLVKTWGTVKAVSQSGADGTRWFHIDDGSHVISDLGDRGLIVYSDADVKQGDQVNVTGISSLEPAVDNPNQMVRVLRTRSVEDVQVTKPAPVWDPHFSDEFDEPVLGPLWAYVKDCGSISVTSNPGSVRLICPEDGNCWPCLSRPIELNEGDTLSMRIRADFSLSPTAIQGVSVLFSSSPLKSVPMYNEGVGIAGMSRHPQYGPWLVAGEEMRPYTASMMDVTVQNGLVTVVADNGAIVLKGSVPAGKPYLMIRVHSENTNPMGRPFAAYVEYVRITPADY